MERNQAISVAIGVGAVGTLLGYLGYSYVQNREPELVEEGDDTVGKEVKTENPKPSFWGAFWADSFNDINSKKEDSTDESPSETNETNETQENKDE